MSPYFRLFQKDAQRFWPYVLIYLALLAVKLSSDSLYTTWTRVFGQSSPSELLGSLTYVALWVLLAALMQQECPVGDQQYWLTRPFTWRQILISKALFVLAFICAPLFIGHIAVLLWIGFPLVQALPGLLMKEAIFAAATVLTVAAIASIARNFARMVLAVIVGYLIASFVSAFVMLMYTPFQSPNNSPYWGVFDWIPKALSFAVLILGASSVILIQYMRRRTVLSRTLGVLTLIGAQAMLQLPPGSWAFAIQERFVRRKAYTSAIQLSMDKERNQSAVDSSWNSKSPHGAILRIPVRIEGLPAGTNLQGAAEQFTVSAVKEGKWRFDWRREGEWSSDWRGLANRTLDLPQPYLLLPLEKEFYERVKDSPVQIAGFVDMILVEHNPVNVHDREYFSGAGAYRFMNGSLSPWPRAHLDMFSVPPYLVFSEECAPWPISISLSPVVSVFPFGAFPAPHVKTVPLELVHPVGYVRRSFAFSNLLPRDYFFSNK